MRREVFNRSRDRTRPGRWKKLLLIAGVPVLLLAALLWPTESRLQAVHAKALRTLEARLGPAELGGSVDWRWNGTVVLGPLHVPSQAAPVVTVERITVRPSFRALLRARVEPGRVKLEGVTLAAGENGQALSEWADAVRRRRPSQKAEDTPTENETKALPAVYFDALHVKGSVKGHAFNVGPLEGQVRIVRDEDALTVRSEGTLASKLTFEGELIRSDTVGAALKLTAKGELPPRFLSVIPQATVDAQCVATVDAVSERASAAWNVKVSNLYVAHPRFAPEPVGPFVLGTSAKLEVDSPKKHVAVNEMKLKLGDSDSATLQFSGNVDFSRDGLLHVNAQADDVDYRAAIAALPPPVQPGEEFNEVGGLISGNFDLDGKLLEPETLKLTGKLDLSRMRARAEPRLYVAGPFVHTVETSGGQTRKLVIGPKNPAFTPLDGISPLLIRAVLLSEDSFFQTHQGFDFASLARNTFRREEGDILRGGSTLTQQLAKNLFLSREKTLSRKIREAFITLALEARLTKSRLLEIYFNIIEWGPGLYGVAEATQHYFAKSPSELTTKEAVFLASVIPNPVRYHGYCSKGATTDIWEQRMADLMHKLHEAGDLSDEALEAGLDEELTFHHPR